MIALHRTRFRLMAVSLSALALSGAMADEASGFLFRGRIRERIAERRAERAAEQTAQAVEAGESGEFRYTLEHRGRERWYLVYAPPSYKAGTPAPLVLNLHGGAGNPNQQRDDSGMNAVADANGFLVVYPAGSGRLKDRFLTWNIGEGDTYAVQQNIDDIGFLRAVIDEVARNFSVDRKRIYATGFSQGAFMCYRLACEAAAQIAAIAPVSGVMLGTGCRPSRPVSIIHFHGVNDPNVAYAGGIGEKAHDKIPRRSVEDTIAWWLKHNGLSDAPTREARKGRAAMKAYGPGANGAEVVLWTLEDGGHTWPGGASSLPERMVGPVNKDIQASALIWEFLQRHSL